MGMHWFKFILPVNDDIIPPEGMDEEQKKQWRIALLTEQEYAAFKWFRMGYTARWTAETMFLDRKTAKKLFCSIYRKLCVADEGEVSREYRGAKLPAETTQERGDFSEFGE